MVVTAGVEVDESDFVSVFATEDTLPKSFIAAPSIFSGTGTATDGAAAISLAFVDDEEPEEDPEDEEEEPEELPLELPEFEPSWLPDPAGFGILI